jgi:hypothetical protein
MRGISICRPEEPDMTAVLERPQTITAVAISDENVLAIAVRLHDQKCRAQKACYNRHIHALDSFEKPVRNFLTVMGAAAAACELR